MANHHHKHKLHLAELDANGKKTGKSVCRSKGTVFLTKDVLQSNCGSCEKTPAWQKAMERQDELEVLAEGNA